MEFPQWEHFYAPGVPRSLGDYPHRTLLDYFRAAVDQRPEAPALYFKGRWFSYRQLDRWSDAFAAALQDRGLGPGDRIALILPNCPQFLIAELGAWKSGLTVVPLNPLYRERELLPPLQSTGARWVVTLSPFYRRLKAIQARTAVETVVVAFIRSFMSFPLRLLFRVFLERRMGHAVRIAPGDIAFTRILTQFRSAPPPEVKVRPEDPAFILLSGGTTGTPKGVLGRHHSLVMTALQGLAWFGSVVKPWTDRILLPLPLFHAYAGVGVQSVALVNPNPVVLVPDPRNLDDLIRTIHRVRPSFLCGVPTLFTALLHHPRVRSGRVDFRSLKFCLCGAAPLLQETRRRFEALTGGRMIEGYSLTEAMIALVAQPLGGEVRPGSTGLPLPDVMVRIVDVEDGETVLPAGKVGEILIHAPQLMDGYYGQDEETRRVLRRHADGRVWLHTGDIGYLDEDGFLYILDRKKDLIKTSGYQVWPREIEEALAEHPDVVEVGVAGVPDPRKGEAVKAWVVLRPGASVKPQELREFCKARLAPYKVPTQFEFRDELPKSPIGKILRRVLRAEHRSTVPRDPSS